MSTPSPRRNGGEPKPEPQSEPIPYAPRPKSEPPTAQQIGAIMVEAMGQIFAMLADEIEKTGDDVLAKAQKVHDDLDEVAAAVRERGIVEDGRISEIMGDIAAGADTVKALVKFFKRPAASPEVPAHPVDLDTIAKQIKEVSEAGAGLEG